MVSVQKYFVSVTKKQSYSFSNDTTVVLSVVFSYKNSDVPINSSKDSILVTVKSL
jgi:hypothetical protein